MMISNNSLRIVLICSTLFALASCSGSSVGISGGGGGTGVALGTSFSTKTQAEPGVLEYRDLVKSSVQRKLVWNGGSVRRPTAFTFQISETGQVSGISQRASSGNDAFDQAALEALERSSPLPAPPANVYSLFHNIRVAVDGPK